MDLHKLSLNQQLEGLKNREFTSIELTSHYLSRISDFDKELNAFITVTEEQALAQAKAAENGRRDANWDFGTNPCSEIILRPNQFCNLTEVVCRSTDTMTTLAKKVKL